MRAETRRRLNNLIRWNITSRRKRFPGKKFLFVSIPKSGRTWLRYFLHNYFSGFHGGDMLLHHRDDYCDGRPPYYFTHDRYENFIYPSFYGLLRGRYLVPNRQRSSARVCLIVRQLPDIMVSLYFQYSKREILYHGNLGDFIRDPLFGVCNVVDVLNGWVAEWGDSPHFIMTAYEHWHLNTFGEFSRIVKWLTNARPDPKLLQKAIEASVFENMRRIEVAGGERVDALQPGSRDDPESFKTRRGVIGGYVDYLAAEDVAYIQDASARLDIRIRQLVSA